MTVRFSRLLGLSLFAMALAIVVNMAPARAGDQDFHLYNHTGVDIHGLYISPTATDHWGTDLLGGQVLKDGGDGSVNFDPDTEAELWDIRVEDEEGNSIYWRKLNLKEISEVVLKPDGVAEVK